MEILKVDTKGTGKSYWSDPVLTKRGNNFSTEYSVYTDTKHTVLQLDVDYREYSCIKIGAGGDETQVTFCIEIPRDIANVLERNSTEISKKLSSMAKRKTNEYNDNPTYYYTLKGDYSIEECKQTIDEYADLLIDQLVEFIKEKKLTNLLHDPDSDFVKKYKDEIDKARKYNKHRVFNAYGYKIEFDCEFYFNTNLDSTEDKDRCYIEGTGYYKVYKGNEEIVKLGFDITDKTSYWAGSFNVDKDGWRRTGWLNINTKSADLNKKQLGIFKKYLKQNKVYDKDLAMKEYDSSISILWGGSAYEKSLPELIRYYWEVIVTILDGLDLAKK